MATAEVGNDEGDGELFTVPHHEDALFIEDGVGYRG